MSKSKEKIFGIIKTISAILVFLMSILAMFLPYYLEIFLGLAIIGLLGYAVTYILQFKQNPLWETIISVLLPLVSAVLTIVLLFGASLKLYYPIEIINLGLCAFYIVLGIIKVNKNKQTKRVIKNVGLGVMAALLCVIGIGGAISNVGYGRTPFSSVVEIFLKATNSGAFDSVESADAYMEQRKLVNDNQYVLPNSNYVSNVHTKELYSHQAIFFDGSKNTDGYVLYIHGGAYVNQMSSFHVGFCDKLAKKINYTVIAPIYPLAPNHTYEETYDLIEKIYTDLLLENKPITIMGDSAGGGFSAAFCEYLTEKGYNQPDKLVLLSPWVDVSMSGETYNDYYDPMLGPVGLKEMGEKWRGTTDIQNYKISPLFGDATGLPKTLMFVGTREIFYPDVNKFNEKLLAANVDVTLIIGQGMNHVFPVYPTFEARLALNQIASFILDK